MADITAAMVKELRELTGAGMMDCKKALGETDGDMDAAVDFLKKSGAAKAEKKASRIAAEGICRVAMFENKKAVVAEVNSETDFVAKNEVFQEFVQAVADTALATGLAGGKNGEDVETLLDKDGLRDLVIEKTAKIGEKLSVRRFMRIEGDCVVSYLHGGGRIGVLVSAKCPSVGDAEKEALQNIAMQVAAMSPEYLRESDISDAERAKMLDITTDSALNDPASLPKPILQKLIDRAVFEKKWSDEDIAIYNEKKSNMNFLFNFLSNEAKTALIELAMADKANIVSDKIFEGLVKGRISKREKEVVLLNQVYVRAEDGKQTVAKYLESVNRDLSVEKFVRFEVGEGMEKKNEDFAAEVAAQMNA
ncbi:MAG: translation elongation factor Ts [Lachnospiraceae bacterium]|nr:translation elongation factor Ts [Lachnospiraceae bacterium]